MSQALTDLFLNLGFVLLAVLALRAALSRRDRHRLDVVFLAVVLLLPPLSRLLPLDLTFVHAAQSGSMSLVPYALIRLVRHFRTVSGLVMILAWALPAVAFVVVALVGRVAAIDVIDAVLWLTVVLEAAIAVGFVSEAARASGLRRRRLQLAAAGTVLLIPGPAVALVQWFGGGIEVWPLNPAYGRVSSGLALICIYLAFTPPRWLFGRWQRSEHAHFLGKVSDREPEERGRMAPRDLLEGIERSVGGAVSFVAISDASSHGDLVVRASTDGSLEGLGLEAGTGMLGRAVHGRRPTAGSLGDCEPEIASRLVTHGMTVLMAPIMSDERVWGVSGVVHRRGALFAEDDLALLMQLGRSTAVALDHAELIAERRARERREADRRLRQLESRVDLMLESIKDYGIIVLDIDGVVAVWQSGAEQLFGHTREDASGLSGAVLFDMEPEPFRQWLDTARSRGHAEREGACRRRDGSTFVGSTTIRPLVDEADVLPAFVAVTQDVTGRRELEERLRQGQKLEAIGRLAGGVAHDFNNLLQAILGHADFLAHDLEGDARLEEVLGIQQAADRGAELTKRLLAFSRRSRIEPTRVDVTYLVSNLVPILRRVIGRHVTIVDATTPDVPPIVGDATQLEQVVMNLAVNARDAMPGGGTLTIRTAEVRMEAGSAGIAPGRYVLLEVSDTGVGMDAETRRLAFEPFFTTKDVGKGTGLGLSTVYGVVQQLNGRIQVETEAGRGTTFRLYLPEHSEAVGEADPLSIDTATGPQTLMFTADAETRASRPL